MTSQRSRDDDPSIVKHTVDDRGHLGDAQRVVITKPIRNYPAFLGFAGSLVLLVMFTWVFAVIVLAASGLGYLLATKLPEGKYLSLIGAALTVGLIVRHLAGA